MDKNLKNEHLLELLADSEHERWSRWMRWMFDNWTEENIIRWKRQIQTPYNQLSEQEKESDRKEARKILTVIHKVIGKNLRDYADQRCKHCKLQSSEATIRENLKGITDNVSNRMARFRSIYLLCDTANLEIP